jgi:hypothetical protein
MDKMFKNQYNPFLWLAYVIVVLSLLTTYITEWLASAMMGMAIVGIIIFAYKLIIRLHVDIVDILGLVLLVLYALCVLFIPFFDMLLFLFSCLLLISLMVCVVRCKDEDAKAIALLHVIYMFSCNLVMPCIGTSI